MKTPRYLIAKYIPDLSRVEPRNVGVVVWTPQAVEARFLAEKPGRPGELDGRSIPSYVVNPNAFRQWIQFWRAELSKVEIEVAGTPAKASRSSDDYLAALQSWNRGNFVLVDAGFLLDPVSPDDLPDLAEHLFRTLVDAGPADDVRDATLDGLCDELIEESGLSNDPNFLTAFPVPCKIDDRTTETFEFSHAYRNGTLQRLYHRVPFSRMRRMLRKTVHDSAWMLEKVTGANILPREHTAALVYASPEQTAEPAVEESLMVLGSVSRVLNLFDRAALLAEFSALARLSVHH